MSALIYFVFEDTRMHYLLVILGVKSTNDCKASTRLSTNKTQPHTIRFSRFHRLWILSKQAPILKLSRSMDQKGHEPKLKGNPEATLLPKVSTFISIFIGTFFDEWMNFISCVLLLVCAQLKFIRFYDDFCTQVLLFALWFMCKMFYLCRRFGLVTSKSIRILLYVGVFDRNQSDP